MEDEFEDFSVSSPFEALVADIQEAPHLPFPALLHSGLTSNPVQYRLFANGRCIQARAVTT
jgi:hypothetical protein